MICGKIIGMQMVVGQMIVGQIDYRTNYCRTNIKVDAKVNLLNIITSLVYGQAFYFKSFSVFNQIHVLFKCDGMK